MTKPALFSLNKQLNVPQLKREFRSMGRVRITPFLSESSAELLRRHVEERRDWIFVLNSGNKTYETTRELIGRCEWEKLERAILEAARHGFQFRYSSIRVPDQKEERLRSGSLLDHFAMFMNSEKVMHVIRQITGEPSINFADAQATAYGPGDFLTGHDDAVNGKHRLAAYVLNLTQIWRAEWGGLLLMHDENSEIHEALQPGFNTLNIFKIPKMHSVSLVTPFADSIRYSITGWLRRIKG